MKQVTPNERIRAARERLGLDEGQVAFKTGLSYNEYWDLENFEDEVCTTMSLKDLHGIGAVLGISVRAILEGDPTSSQSMTFAEFSNAVRAAVAASGQDVEQWGERAGWDIAPILDDPDQVWELSVDAVRDISDAAGIDWRPVIPE